jgi:hypothetical protein
MDASLDVSARDRLDRLELAWLITAEHARVAALHEGFFLFQEREPARSHNFIEWPIGLLLTTQTLNCSGYLRRETLLHSSDI